MIDQTQWRNYLLIVSSISINLAVVYSFLIPTAGNRQVAEFEFPQNFDTAQAIAFPNLEAIATPQNFTNQQQTEVIKARQQYKYTKNGRAIALEINYLVGTRGDVTAYLQNYTDISEQTIKTKSIGQIEGIGHHALFRDNQQAYLTSCISPRSLSNVTQKQFSQYRYENDLNWQTGWKWMQGQASIRDRRCLWVLLSTPATKDSIKADYQALETAWEDIYQWWIPNFPKLVSNERSHLNGCCNLNHAS